MVSSAASPAPSSLESRSMAPRRSSRSGVRIRRSCCLPHLRSSTCSGARCSHATEEQVASGRWSTHSPRYGARHWPGDPCQLRGKRCNARQMVFASLSRLHRRCICDRLPPVAPRLDQDLSRQRPNRRHRNQPLRIQHRECRLVRRSAGSGPLHSLYARREPAHLLGHE